LPLLKFQPSYNTETAMLTITVSQRTVMPTIPLKRPKNE